MSWSMASQHNQNLWGERFNSNQSERLRTFNSQCRLLLTLVLMMSYPVQCRVAQQRLLNVCLDNQAVTCKPKVKIKQGSQHIIRHTVRKERRAGFDWIWFKIIELIEVKQCLQMNSVTSLNLMPDLYNTIKRKSKYVAREHSRWASAGSQLEKRNFLLHTVCLSVCVLWWTCEDWWMPFIQTHTVPGHEKGQDDLALIC